MLNKPQDDLTIPPFLDRRPLVYSYSLLNAYRNCGHAMFRRYIKKDIPYEETEAIKWGNYLHGAFEHRIAYKTNLPADLAQHEPLVRQLDSQSARVETKLGITKDGEITGYFDKDCWLRCKIDVHMRQGDRAYILDWKTGNSRYEDPFELEIAALLLKAQHKESVKHISGHYVWLKENRHGKSYDLSNFAGTWTQIKRLVAAIENERKIDDFEKRQSGLCKFCSVFDCEYNRRDRLPRNTMIT